MWCECIIQTDHVSRYLIRTLKTNNTYLETKLEKDTFANNKIHVN